MDERHPGGPNARCVLTRTCIVCPRGCRLSITTLGSVVEVSGHACPKGVTYGTQEATAPLRLLTTTVRTTYQHLSRLAVKSTREVPLGDILSLMRHVDCLCLDHPVRCGEVVARDLGGLGVDLVATDDLEQS